MPCRTKQRSVVVLRRRVLRALLAFAVAFGAVSGVGCYGDRGGTEQDGGGGTGGGDGGGY
jgi:hypothetical protein